MDHGDLEGFFLARKETLFNASQPSTFHLNWQVMTPDDFLIKSEQYTETLQTKRNVIPGIKTD